jgi:hypothetical protein
MFDESLDKEIATKEVYSVGGVRLTVGIYQYNGSTPKVQIKRERNTKNGSWKFAKLGRLTADEVRQITTGLQWASETLDTMNGEGSQV